MLARTRTRAGGGRVVPPSLTAALDTLSARELEVAAQVWRAGLMD